MDNDGSGTTGNNPPEGNRASLTCHQILSPPAKQIGEGENQLTFKPCNQIAWYCTFSYDGNYLAACFGGYEPHIRIWKKHTSATGTISWELYTTLSGVHDRTIRCIAFAPLYKPLILASASFDGTIAIWEEEEKISSDNQHDKWICSAQLEGHDNEVKCVAWNATGSLLASCGRDKTVWIWESYLEGTIGGKSRGNNGGGGGGSDFECLAVLNGHGGDVKCVIFAPSYGEYGDGDEILLSASYDDTIKCWAEDTSTGDWFCAVTISGVHTSTIWTLAIAPSGTRLLSGSGDGTIAIYKSYTESEKKHMIQTMSLSEQKQIIQSTTTGNGFWKCIGTLPNVHNTYPIYSISYASIKVGHCRVASAGADNTIVICRESNTTSTSDHPKYEIECTSRSAHSNENNNNENTPLPAVDINCVCWHPTDGSILASACDDGTIRIWNYTSSSSI